MTERMKRSGYKSCQSLVKGLQIIQVLNKSSNGASSISGIVESTGIHRTTVKRMLETLLDEGFVKHDHVSNMYRLTYQVQSLSYGFRDSVKIVDVAWPYMMSITKELIWPCSLLSLEGKDLVVRASTHAYSPFSFHTGMPGRKLSILDTAAGKAYISYCSENERRSIATLLKDEFPDVNRRIRAVVKSTVGLGYGINRGEWKTEPRFGGLSVPIKVNQSVAACINIIFLNHAVSDEEIDKLSNKLIVSRDEIEAEAVG